MISFRFVVKLSDFGPQCLMSERKCVREEDPQKRFRRKLWTAPELLRESSQRKTQKVGLVHRPYAREDLLCLTHYFFVIRMSKFCIEAQMRWLLIKQLQGS